MEIPFFRGSFGKFRPFEKAAKMLFPERRFSPQASILL